MRKGLTVEICCTATRFGRQNRRDREQIEQSHVAGLCWNVDREIDRVAIVERGGEISRFPSDFSPFIYGEGEADERKRS